MSGKRLFSFVFILYGFVLVQAQSSEVPNLNSKLDKIFELSKKNNFNELNMLIALEKDGNNKITSYLPDKANLKDMTQVKRMGKSINALLTISDSYQFTKTEAENYNDQSTISVTVDFSSGEQVISKKFRFIKLNDVYLLLKID